MKTPSQKQIDLADKIATTLNLDFPKGDYEFSAYSYWKFINDNINEYIEVVNEAKAMNNFDDDIFWGYDLGLWEF